MNQVPPVNRAIFFALAAGGATLDLFTKWLAFAKVGEPNSKRVVWDGVFSFTTSYNKGALWGLARDIPFANIAFACLSLIAAFAILYWLFARGAASDRLLTIALGLIMAGTVGNCYDRLVWGQVRDFIYFELINWPIFNLADSMLVCGAAVLMLQAVFAEPHGKQTAIVSSSAQAAEMHGE